MGKRRCEPIKPDWHHEDVKAAIRKTGISLAALAVKNSVPSNTLTKGFARLTPAALKILADHLGTTPQTIWPSRYDDRGEPIDRRGSHLRKNSRRHGAAQRKKSEQA